MSNLDPPKEFDEGAELLPAVGPGQSSGPCLKALILFVAMLALGTMLVALGERNQALQNQKAAADVAAMHGHLLQEQMNRSLSATYALAAVLRQGNGRIDNFDALAADMLHLYGGLSALQLAPGGIISSIVPLKGNEAALGHNLLLDPERNKEAFSALETRRLTLAGPFVLRQGGVAVVGRLPVFLAGPAGGERFWGFATALIRITDLLAASKLSAAEAGDYDFELSRIHPDTGQRDVFAASSPLPLQDPVSYVIDVPNGRWTLAMARIDGWHSSWLMLGMEAAVVLALSVLVTSLAFNVLKQPLILRREVELRTRELSEANRKLEAEIVERRLAEEALRESESRLERRVAERTAELSAANTALHEEQIHQRELIGKLEETQNQLLQSEKMASIGQLAAGVAHEINNPIGFVNSNLASLRRYADDLLALTAAYETGADPLLAAHSDILASISDLKARVDLEYLRGDLPKLLQETQEGVIRVRKIVQALREFSHVDESGWHFADLHHELDSTLEVIGNELKNKAGVIKEYGPVPAVECIPSQLNQVFMNLLLNAAHAIEGRGVVTVRTALQGDMVRIEVEDTGKGIPPENLQRIFEPFFTTKPVGQGSGLGLSLSYGIVKKHGGSIEVESEVGKGSLFRICLPVARGRSPREDEGGHSGSA